MNRKNIWWPRILGGQPFKPPGEDSLAQEDGETRTIIRRYLHLAERMLSRQRTQAWKEEDSDAA